MSLKPERQCSQSEVARKGYRSKYAKYLIAFLFAVIFFLLSCTEKIENETGAPKELSPNRHADTTWKVSPSYPHDALAFLELLTGEPGSLSWYDEDPASAYRDMMTQEERRAVNRIRFIIGDCLQSNISGSLAYLYDMSGASDLQDFRSMISMPRQLMSDFRRELEIYSVYYLKSLRIPLWLFDRFCKDLELYLSFLQRVNFRRHWMENYEPLLTTLSEQLNEELEPFNLIPQIEAVLGGALPSREITIYLGCFLRPRAYSMTGAKFLCEDRVDAHTLLKVAAHELIHGYVDWSSEDYKKLTEIISRDPRVLSRLIELDLDKRKISWISVAEESWTEALDQIVMEKTTPMTAEDPKVRWWFDGDIKGSAALALYRSAKRYMEHKSTSLTVQLKRDIEEEIISDGFIERNWKEEYGISRPGSLPEDPSIRKILNLDNLPLGNISNIYKGISLKKGQFAVVLEDWFPYEGRPENSLLILDQTGWKWDRKELIDPMTGTVHSGRYIGSGNMSTDKMQQTWYYGNVLYFQSADQER